MYTLELVGFSMLTPQLIHLPIEYLSLSQITPIKHLMLTCH